MVKEATTRHGSPAYHCWFLPAVLFIMVLVVAGCSTQRKLIPTPNLYTIADQPLFENLAPELQTNQIDLLYVTDRNPEKDSSGQLNYGFKRSSSLAFGSAVVEFGEDLPWETLVDYSTHKATGLSRPTVKVVAIEEKGRFPPTPYSYRITGESDTFEITSRVLEERQEAMAKGKAEIVQRLSLTPTKELFVFIHGINYTFEEAVEVVAEGYHYLGRQGLSIVYTWPAGSKGLFNYAYDRESGEFTIFHLKNFIRFLTSIEEVEKIHFISHSRGTDVLATALRELWLEIRSTTTEPREQFKIGNVILIAPDLDFEVSMQRLVAESIGSFFDRMTIYSSTRDEAINAAKILFSSLLRIGAVDQDKLSDQQRKTIHQLTNLDIISYEGATGGSFGHSYFLNNPAVSSDILALLRYKWAPGKEHGRPLEHIWGNFWKIDDDYPFFGD